MLFRLLIVLCCFLVITVLFKLASGSLSLLRLNIVSITYYLYIVAIYIGAAIMYLGLANNHYMVRRLDAATIEETFFLVVATGIGLVCIVIIINFFFKNINTKTTVDKYYQAECLINYDENKLYSIVVLLILGVLFSSVYTFLQIGGIPILDTLGSERMGSLAARNQAKYAFTGIVYIRNLGMLALAPFLSLFTFICYRSIGTKRWRNAALVCLFLAVVALTYDLEKVPIVLHLLFLYIADCILGRTYNKRQIAGLSLVAGSLLIIGYIITGGSDALTLNFENGIFARIAVAYPSAFGLHLFYFPSYCDFLNGGALPDFYSLLFSLGDNDIRSARVIMSIINASGVQGGTAGVVNTYYVGEAYANWGYFGVVLGVLVVGLFVGLTHNIVLQCQKTIFTSMAYLIFLRFQATTFLGGYLDYLFNITLLFMLGVLLLIYLVVYKRFQRAHY